MADSREARWQKAEVEATKDAYLRRLYDKRPRLMLIPEEPTHEDGPYLISLIFKWKCHVECIWSEASKRGIRRTFDQEQYVEERVKDHLYPLHVADSLAVRQEFAGL